jgi:hypothetical protein
MAVTVSPVGLAAAPVNNVAAIMATYKERLCRSYCTDSTIQPQVSVVYTTGTAKLNESTVFVPVTATITIVTQENRCGCNAHTQLFTENFVVAFQGQTALPTSVTLTNVGRDAFGSNVNCGRAYSYTINDSITVTLA